MITKKYIFWSTSIRKSAQMLNMSHYSIQSLEEERRYKGTPHCSTHICNIYKKIKTNKL